MKEYIIEAYMESNTGSAAMGRTVDELIRCRDCKAYNGMKCVRNNMIAVRVNDYCSRAERKEE